MIRAIVSAPPQVPGDYNRDGTVDTADYVVWRTSFGQSIGPTSGADGNGDGIVDDADYEFWRANFGGNNRGSGAVIDAASTVPEPHAATLLTIAAFMFATRRRTPRRLPARS